MRYKDADKSKEQAKLRKRKQRAREKSRPAQADITPSVTPAEAQADAPPTAMPPPTADLYVDANDSLNGNKQVKGNPTKMLPFDKNIQARGGLRRR